MKALIGQHLPEPFGAHKNRLPGPKNILDGIIDHRHQGNNGAEGDDHKNRQHQQPSSVIWPFFHSGYPP